MLKKGTYNFSISYKLKNIFSLCSIGYRSSRRHRKMKHFRTDETQTSQNTTILYYHESKRSAANSFEVNHDDAEENLIDIDDTNNNIEDLGAFRKFSQSELKNEKVFFKS